MKIVKTSFRSLLIVGGLIVLTVPVWIKRVPLEYLSPLTNKTPLIDKYVCRYAVNVAGDSMAPMILPGSSIELKRCFKTNDLTAGTVVLFDGGSGQHLGVIRHVLQLDPVVYKVSNERPGERLQDLVIEDIVAINKEIDTSETSYRPSSEESLILDPDEYITDFYLGKIPRGNGVEMAKLERTNTFTRDTDKFCFVIIPKKELAFVDIEIVDTQTQKTVVSYKDIVFNVRPDPNTNCSDFGTGQDMLDLKPGSYRHRVLLNHQLLADETFEVK